MPSTLHCVLLFGKYRLLLASADENSVQTALNKQKAIDRRDAIRERPSKRQGLFAGKHHQSRPKPFGSSTAWSSSTQPRSSSTASSASAVAPFARLGGRLSRHS
jgi:hypothetical protein